MSPSLNGSRIIELGFNGPGFGPMVLILCTALSLFFFAPGGEVLIAAWALPEYSHGPLIPLLSGLLFLRQLKEYPAQPVEAGDRWAGVWVVAGAIALGAFGRLTGIADIVTYALILWVGGLLLIGFGWKRGKHFWPPVLHLVYMLPLPGILYYEITNGLQFISSELGVWFLRLLAVPVFLDGNVIDLGVTKLHVAEACSGLRYLFPILSFSYVFAALYRGPVWHKAVLLIAAAPIAILMNSIRITVAGFIVNTWGLSWVNGFTHFFEGWVIFVISILLLFVLAWALLRFQPSKKMKMVDALDLEVDGLWRQARRLRHVVPSAALIAATALTALSLTVSTVLPERDQIHVDRKNFLSFPRQIGQWQRVGPPHLLDRDIERVLGADDYFSGAYQHAKYTQSVGIFMSWYGSQATGGIHSPEVCLPAGGWEIAEIQKIDMQVEQQVWSAKRAIIQKGEQRMMVLFWFDIQGRKVASGWISNLLILGGKFTHGREDSGLVRLTTPIADDEALAFAETRLRDAVNGLVPNLPSFFPPQ